MDFQDPRAFQYSQKCSTVNAAVKEDFEFFVFFNASGPLVQAIERSQSKEHKSFTKPKIRLQINQLTAWRGLRRPRANFLPGMSSTISTSSSSTCLRSIIRNIKKMILTKNMRHGGPPIQGEKQQRSAKMLRQLSSATTNSDCGPATSPITWWDHAPNEFQQAIDFYQAQQQGHQTIVMWDSSSEGDCRQTTTSRGKHRHRPTPSCVCNPIYLMFSSPLPVLVCLPSCSAPPAPPCGP